MSEEQITKTFCILEQGKYVGEALTKKHKEQFTTEFSDFYRLNWYTDKDPLADFHAKNITLSEGKNLLYERVPKIYHYYIFIDDDIELELSPEITQNITVAEKIREILDCYAPLHGTFYRKDGTKWGAWHIAEVAQKHSQNKRKAWPVFGFDLDCDIYHYSYIQHVFPIKYHGCYKCLAYTQYIGHKLYQNKQLIFDEIRLNNIRKSDHSSELALPQSNNNVGILKLFHGDLLNNELNKNAKFLLGNTSMIPKINNQIYLGPISKDEIIFTSDDMNKICNWQPTIN